MVEVAETGKGREREVTMITCSSGSRSSVFSSNTQSTCVCIFVLTCSPVSSDLANPLLLHYCRNEHALTTRPGGMVLALTQPHNRCRTSTGTTASHRNTKITEVTSLSENQSQSGMSEFSEVFHRRPDPTTARPRAAAMWSEAPGRAHASKSTITGGHGWQYADLRGPVRFRVRDFNTLRP